MDKRTLLALFLALVILFAFQAWFAPKQEPAPSQPAPEGKAAPQAGAPQEKTGQQSAQQQGTETKQAPPPPAATPVAPPATSPAAAPKPTKFVTVETREFTVKLSDVGGGIASVRLKNYKETVGGELGKELIEETGAQKYTPYLYEQQDGKTVTDNTIFTADRDRVTATDKPETVVLTGSLPDGRKVQKSYTFNPDGYTIGFKLTMEPSSKAGTFLDFATISLKDKSSYSFKGPFVYNGKKLNQIEKLDKSFDANKSYTYAGFDEGYFSFIWIPDPATKPSLIVASTDQTIPVERLVIQSPQTSGTLYFGPNKIETLKGLGIGAEKIVDFGWFDIVAKPMLWGMNWANRITHNYGIDIILLTILIKIIFYPLSVKSYKSMKNMQKLQPVVAKLKEKYKNDREKLNAEMMQLYKQKGVNPLGGCLPMIIQIPVFFALYKVLMAAIEFRHAPFMLWINDLASPEHLYSFHVAGYELPVRILPLIMGITMVLQQKMTPTSVDPLQEKMMMFMPIFFTFLFWGFPAGLVLYWLVNNIVSIAQQYYINRQVS